jgi:hypothetical protein
MDAPFTLLFMKSGARQYSHFARKDELCEFVITLFEHDEIEKARSANGTVEVLQYGSADLINFLDLKFAELLILRRDMGTTPPRLEQMDAEWLKMQLCQYMVDHAEIDVE